MAVPSDGCFCLTSTISKNTTTNAGHALGDEILKENRRIDAALLPRARFWSHAFGRRRICGWCFWEKEIAAHAEGPAGADRSRPCFRRKPLQILQRFRKAISSSEFSGLGVNGRGILTIRRAGLRVFRGMGRTVTELVEAADRAIDVRSEKGWEEFDLPGWGGDAQKNGMKSYRATMHHCPRLSDSSDPKEKKTNKKPARRSFRLF